MDHLLAFGLTILAITFMPTKTSEGRFKTGCAKCAYHGQGGCPLCVAYSGLTVKTP